MIVFTMTIIGLCYGSFINVLIYRLPNKISIVSPRSFCPHCKSKIPLFRNIPVISFIIQKGKCYDCNAKISIQYPIVEILTGFLWFWAIYNIDSILNVSFSIVIINFLIPMAFIDAKYLKFSRKLMIPLIGFSILKMILSIMLYSDKMPLYGMITAIIFLTSIYWIVRIWFKIKGDKKNPMGYGDIILSIPLGIWLEPLGILVCFFISSLFGLFIWLILYSIKNFSFNEKMPFGPYLIGSAILIKITNLTDWISVLISQIK